jgi:hypothetical protein
MTDPPTATQVAHLQDGEGALHVCRGRPGVVPALHVRLPSLSAPLPTSPRAFQALAAPALALPAAAAVTEAQRTSFERDGYLLLKVRKPPSWPRSWASFSLS